MFKFLIVLAFALRLILMPISAHSDLFFINSFPNLLVTQNIFDIYLHVKDNIPDARFSYYPPLTYYTFAFFQIIYQYFSSSFSPWMTNLVDLYSSSFSGQAADFINAAPNSHIFRDIFLAKTPYLIFDFGAFIVLINFVKKRLIKNAAIFIWLFNPVSIYAAYIMGQFDLIPAFFILLGFFLLRKNLKFAVISLGIAAAYKNYAFLLIIPTVLIYSQRLSERLKLLMLASLPYIIFLIPALIHSLDEVIYSLLPKVYLHYRKPLEGWALYSQMLRYMSFICSYFLIFVLAYFSKVKDKWRFALGLSLVSLLLFYAFAPRISFHYLLWSLPLILLYFNQQKTALILIVVQAISLSSYKLLANHLQAGLFAPLNLDFFSQIPTFNSIVDKFIPYRIISTIGFLVFFFVNLYFAIKILNELIFQGKTR